MRLTLMGCLSEWSAYYTILLHQSCVVCAWSHDQQHTQQFYLTKASNATARTQLAILSGQLDSSAIPSLQ